MILTNGNDLVKEADVGGQLGNSDHCEIRFILKGGKDVRSVNKHRVPDFKKANYEGLRRHLKRISWSWLKREDEFK